MTLSARYRNGQIIKEQNGDVLTHYFMTGILKAQGVSIDGVMEGEWIFNRDGGKLWQVGHFVHGLKHGVWVRYNKEGVEDYREEFIEGRLIKPEIAK